MAGFATEAGGSASRLDGGGGANEAFFVGGSLTGGTERGAAERTACFAVGFGAGTERGRGATEMGRNEGGARMAWTAAAKKARRSSCYRSRRNQWALMSLRPCAFLIPERMRVKALRQPAALCQWSRSRFLLKLSCANLTKTDLIAAQRHTSILGVCFETCDRARIPATSSPVRAGLSPARPAHKPLLQAGGALKSEGSRSPESIA